MRWCHRHKVWVTDHERLERDFAMEVDSDCHIAMVGSDSDEVADAVEIPHADGRHFAIHYLTAKTDRFLMGSKKAADDSPGGSGRLPARVPGIRA